MNSEKNKTRRPAIIPKPTRIEWGRGVFELTPGTEILLDTDSPEAVSAAKYLAGALGKIMGCRIKTGAGAGRRPQSGCIALELSGHKNLGDEGYECFVSRRGIVIRAPHPCGLFRGVQTLRHMLAAAKGRFDPRQGHGALPIPCARIRDIPRFAWRGLLLDCCRHFMSKPFILRLLDVMAYYKLNRLHWHLTEDQGWRIEIKRYPELTTKGAWRRQGRGKKYGGFYTQDDIREIVAYAAERHIEVIPEIEMPGHCNAALACHPELSCTGGPFKLTGKWGIYKDVYCAGNEKTFRFLENVLEEVVSLFPSSWIHIGADEVPKDRWRACPKCQARIRREGLKDEHELQTYFVRRIMAFLRAKGKRAIGWDEVMEGGLAPGVVVQHWRTQRHFAHPDSPMKDRDVSAVAARQGHDVIRSPNSHCYFDHPVSSTDLRRVYEFDPIPDGMSKRDLRHILGGEACMWTEHAPQKTIYYKLFPRLAAFSEVFWSGGGAGNFDEFSGRWRFHAEYLRSVGVRCGPASFRDALSYPARFKTTMGIIGAPHNFPPEMAFDGVIGSSNAYNTGRPVKKGETFSVILERPEKFKRIRVFFETKAAGLWNGVLEVSRDGRRFEALDKRQASRRIDGGSQSEPAWVWSAALDGGPVKAVRLRATQDQPTWVAIMEIALRH